MTGRGGVWTFKPALIALGVWAIWRGEPVNPWLVGTLLVVLGLPNYQTPWMMRWQIWPFRKAPRDGAGE